MLPMRTTFRFLPLGKSLSLIVVIFVGIVVFVVGLNNLRSEILSGVRAYVSGEGLYSKGQKDAVNYLVRYAHSHAERDYAKYLAALAIPLGDRQARLELEKPQPNLDVAYRGFRAAHNHPEDIENMAKLFRRFRNVSFMARAIDVWAQGDALIEALQGLGEELHASITSGQADAARTGRVLEQIDVLNERLTGLEDEFSRTLGQGNRWLEHRLLQITYGTTALLVIAGMLGSWMILREVREADRVLRAQAERWRVTLASIGDAVLVTDAAATVVSLNAVAEALTGWSEAEAIGRNLDEVLRITGERPDQVVQNPARRVLQEGRIVGLNNRSVLRGRDGTQRPIDDSAAPIKDQEGRIVGVVLVFRDVSERRRAEEQAAARAREHEAIARLGETALSGHDLHALMSDAAGYVTGTLATDLCEVLELTADGRKLLLRAGVGWEASALGTTTLPADSGSPAACALASGTPLVLDDLRTESRCSASALLQAHGAVSGMSVVIAGEEGRRYGVLGTYVTRRRAFGRDEVNFLCAVANVLAVAIERKHAEEALHDANRQKDNVLAMLAHELRNPLSPIRNAMHVLRRRGVDAAQLEWAGEMIDRQVAHMSRLLDDLLDVSRVARGKISLHKERLDFGQVVRVTAEDYRATLEAQGLRMTVDVPEQALPVRGDPTRLSQAVGNLLHNAGKFTNPGGQVTVRLEKVAESDGVLLRIRDTGIGIEPAVLARVFDTFSQADHSLDRSRGGLGLGLALVKGLVELHGGAVEAHSGGLGCGSEFVIHLPLDTAPAEPAAAPGARAGGVRPCRVLVIEDNRDVADSMKYLLESDGHSVAVAHTGAAGIEAARRFFPQVVLCDIGLPGGLDGFGVARMMRDDTALSSAYLVALTGYGQAEDRRRVEEAGFDMHLIKPVDPDVLDQVLAKVTERAVS